MPAMSQRVAARRVAPFVGAGALVAGAALLATHDPSAPGSAFLACPFHQTTGLWCPGCGLTRGCYALLHGRLGTALSFNVFTPVVVVAIVVAWVAWMQVAWGHRPIRVPERVGRWLWPALPALVLLYGVLRNIPVAPLKSLAP